MSNHYLILRGNHEKSMLMLENLLHVVNLVQVLRTINILRDDIAIYLSKQVTFCNRNVFMTPVTAIGLFFAYINNNSVDLSSTCSYHIIIHITSLNDINSFLIIFD